MTRLRDNDAVPDDVRSAVVDTLRDAVRRGDLSLVEFESVLGKVMEAESDALLGDLVRQHAPPVRITPDGRRLPDVVELETTGMFANIKRTGVWQVPKRLRARTGGSWVILDFTEAEFDAWEVDVEATVGSGDVLVTVAAGTALQLVKSQRPVSSKLQPPVPGFPVIRLSASTGLGRIRLRHPKQVRSKN